MQATQLTDLLDTGDLATLLGVTRAHITGRLTKRPDFPRPAIDLSQKMRRWRLQDVTAWASGTTTAPLRPRPSRGSTRPAAGANRGARTHATAA